METHRLLLDEAGKPIVYMRTPLLPYEVAWSLYTSDWQAALKELFASNRELRLAIRIASPSLARELAKWLADETVSARALRRLFAYALRASTRTTPFGLFAAISRAEIGDNATLEVNAEMRTRTRIDMGWLNKLCAQWRDDPDLRRDIRVTLNDAILRRGARYTAYHPLHTGRLGEKGHLYKPITFTATEPVRFLEDEARMPTSLRELAKRLEEQYDEPPEECFRLLEELWQAGFFVDELAIDPTADDPPRDILERVETRDAGRTGNALALLDELSALDARPLSSRTEADYEAVAASQYAILPNVDNASQTDACRSAMGTFPAQVLKDVGLLAQLMLRGPAMTLMEYRKRFAERYEGTTREVPLLELVHPQFGLGAPESLDHDPLPNDLLERQTLAACEALRDGTTEITIDRQRLDTLMPRLEETRLATSFDLGFEVLASSREALDRGEYLIAPGAFTFAPRAGAALGRFAGALGERALSDLRAIAAELEALHQDVIVAELVAAPSWSRVLNVAIRPVMHSHQVRVGFMKDDASASVIALDDLIVGLDDAGFYVRSLSRGKRLILTESHAVNTPQSAPTIARFLSQLAYEGLAFPREYEWDCRVSFFPRVRCERIILRKASWRFTREVIEEAVSDSFEAFAKRWAMPRYIELVSLDNRLLIDTTSEIGPLLLLDHLRPGREIVLLEEVLCVPENVWVKEPQSDGRFRAEFIASFARALPIKGRSTSSDFIPREERLFAPGSDWLYVKLYTDGHDDDRLLIDHIAPLMQRHVAQGDLEHWYFLRYADPRSHLRVRMKSAKAALPQVSASIFDLLRDLTQAGVTDTSGIMTYEREIERYGGLEGTHACETVFAADSEHVLSYVASEPLADLEGRVAFVARSIAEMALECSDAVDGFDARAFISERTSLSDADRMSARTIKKAVHAGRIIGPKLRSALCELAALDSRGRLTLGLANIFNSLVHMHANRSGLNAQLESRARALAREVLQGLEHAQVTIQR